MPTIANLPDDLLVRCLAPLSQEERLGTAALVCKRWQEACLCPDLLRDLEVTVSSSCFRRRLPALQALLADHAAHVHSLHLILHESYGASAPEEESALLGACLAACGAAGRLERLQLLPASALPCTDWLPRLLRLRSLDMHFHNQPMRLPADITRLTALVEAELEGSVVVFEGGALPPSLTCLVLSDDESTQLPARIGAPSALAVLHLDCRALAADALSPPARLPALRTLGWHSSQGLPQTVSGLTQLQALFVSFIADSDSSAAVIAVLPFLPRLTTLSLQYEDVGEFDRLPAFLTAASGLQRLCVNTDEYEGMPAAAGLQLPPGPWLASLRWLGVPWSVLAASAEALRGATRLEYLASLSAPQEGEAGTAARHAWAAAWSLLETLPALRCFLMQCMETSTVKAYPLMRALGNLKRRRPELAWRAACTLVFESEILELAELPDMCEDC